MGELKQSPLHDRHVALGAKFAEFGGWTMPLQYSSVVAEHKAVRSGVGIFDVSHLGKARVSGPGAKDFVNTCFTNDLDKVGPGQAQYTLCCTTDGHVVDDIMQYLMGDDEVFLVPNASNNRTVVDLLSKHSPDEIEVFNHHDDYVILAVQGPLSDEVLRAAGAPVDFEYMRFEDGTVAGHGVTVCRTGYTGERGYEVFCEPGSAVEVWDALLAAGEPHGITPAGLGARDTLRTEMGYPLHGHELSRDISPVEAGATWAVGWDKPEFWGSDALRAERAAGPKRRLRGFKAVGRGIPRPGMSIVDDEGTEIGVVTSGTFSPTLSVGIALGFTLPQYKPGDRVSIRIRDKVEPFTIEKLPLVQPQVRQA